MNIMRLLGQLPKSLADRIFDALGGLNEAQYEHERPVQRQRESAPVPFPNFGSGQEMSEIGPDYPSGGEAAQILNPNQEITLPPPQETVPGPEQRTGKLSRFGIFTHRILPAMARGALVGVANPVKGDTAANIFGTIRNVEADQQARTDRAQQQAEKQWEWHRTARKDAENTELHKAQIDNYQAMARERDARAAKNLRVSDPIAAAKAKLEILTQTLGRKPTEQEVLIALGFEGPRYAKRTMETMLANAYEDYLRGPDSARLQEQFATIQDYITYINTMATNYSAAKTSGEWQAKTPWINPRFRDTETPEGTVRTGFRIVPDAEGKPMKEETREWVTTPEGQRAKPKPRQSAPRQRGPSDERLDIERSEVAVANTALQAANGDPQKAIAILNDQAAKNPNVASHLVGATKRLKALIDKESQMHELIRSLAGSSGTRPPTSPPPASNQQAPRNPFR